MKKAGLISIIMPFRDEEEFLSDCLTSIQNQTYDNWELWAVDDHSSDRGLSIIREKAKDDHRIHIVLSKGRGIPAALQTGCEKCTGDIITRMDADDIMPPEKLNILKSQLKENTVSTGLVQYFSEETLGQGYRDYAEKMNQVMLSQTHEIHAFQECFLPSPAWMMYRSDFEKIGGFDNMLLPEDYDLYFRILISGFQINAYPKVVHFWRDSPNRTSRVDPIYQPLKFIELKIYYFLRWMRNPQNPLVLWGAGKRGKAMAAELNKKGVRYLWITDNSKKLAAPIYGKKLENRTALSEQSNPQILLSIASPEERIEVRKYVEEKLKLIEGKHFWWFC